MYSILMNKNKNIFSERLIALRKAKGLTQEQLAEKLNVTRSKVAYLESRTKNPTTESIKLVADFFEIPLKCFSSQKFKNKKKRVLFRN